MKWSLPTPDFFRPLVLLFFPALLCFLNSCSSSSPASQGHHFQQPMTAYLQSDLADEGVAEPLVHITVPLRNLVFSRHNGVISGGVEVVVVAWQGQQQVGGAVACESISLPDWQATNSDSLLVLDVRVPLETSSRVILEVRARSLGTSRTWNRSIAWNPDQWRRLPLVFKKWIWNADADGLLNAAADSLKVELFTSRVAFPMDEVQDVSIEVLIRGRDGFELSTRQNVIPVDSLGTTCSHILAVSLDQLPFGRYQALARLICGTGGENEHISPWYPTRNLLISRINYSDDKAWELQLGWLEGIFKDEDLDLLADLQVEQREEHFTGLWGTGKNNSRNELNHLLNILEADSRFEGSERGALTDQGRSWIRYGQPDHIENKGNMEGRYRRWQIWHYRDSGLRLTFLDAHGLGEYRLIETEYSTD